MHSHTSVSKTVKNLNRLVGDLVFFIRIDIPENHVVFFLCYGSVLRTNEIVIGDREIDYVFSFCHHGKRA